MRAFPLAGAVGDKFKPRLGDVAGGAYLGSLVNRTNDICTDIYDDEDDDVASCASYVANSWLSTVRK